MREDEFQIREREIKHALGVVAARGQSLFKSKLVLKKRKDYYTESRGVGLYEQEWSRTLGIIPRRHLHAAVVLELEGVGWGDALVDERLMPIMREALPELKLTPLKDHSQPT